MEFTATEKAILRMIQKDLPMTREPYADIAAACGTTEDEVLSLIRRLKDEGVIRRFGASIRHQKSGYTHNAMVAWKIDPADVDKAGAQASEFRNISHCYWRPSAAEDWPYTFYTMIHGKSREECMAVVEQLKETTVLKEYEVLETVEELKKISMQYFD